MTRNTSIYLIVLLALLAGCSLIPDGPQEKLETDGESILSSYSEGTRTLPVVLLSTADGRGITDKNSWKAAEISVCTPDGADAMESGYAGVKGRGHGSWNFPKKGFNVRFSEETEMLGMESADRWCMLANWRDVTRMRNAVSLEIARQTSLEWTPDGRFVELVLDGCYWGNYYLTEKIETGPDKVDIGLDGMFVCLDSYFDADFRFRTALRSLPVNIELPSGTTLDKAAFEEYRTYFDRVEKAVYKDGGWDSLIDARSFCDWLIVHELTTNDEPTRPHSVYMYRSPGGKLMAGPAWDFDCRTFRPGVEGFVNRNAVWFDALLKDPAFCAILKDRWEQLLPSLEEQIPDFIDNTAGYIRESALADRALWPMNKILSSSNGDESLGFDEAVARLRAAYVARLDALGRAISELP